MAFDLSSKTHTARDWSCGAADADADMDSEGLVNALERIDAVNRANSKKLLTAMKLGAVSDLERQNFSNFLRAWRSYMSQVKSKRTQRKQVQTNLKKWMSETNAWTVKLNGTMGAAKAALKQPISTKPPEVLAAAVAVKQQTEEAAVGDDGKKNTLMLVGLGASALALGLMLGGSR